MTPWKQDPSNTNTLYVGMKTMYKSTNQGTSWSSLTSPPNTSADVREFAIAPSNNQVIYVLKTTGIYKTSNAGSTWTTVTNGVPVGQSSPQYICIDPQDPDNAWVVLSGYNAGQKVYTTTDGGASWTNISGNLPNIPANCCVYQPGSNDRIYVGMDVGIYYWDNGASTWTLYNAGLPNTPVSELEITPANPNMLYAATYGRGVWAADLVSIIPVAPLTNFSVSAVTICTNTLLTLNDQSNNAPSAWSWSVTPSSGYTLSSITDRHPQIIFAAPGTYTISSQASNSVGVGNLVTKTIQVLPSPTVSAAANVHSVCSGAPVTLTAGGAPAYSWSHNGGSASSAVFHPQSSTVYTVTGILNSCEGIYTVAVNVQQGPVITIAGSTTSCAGDAVVLSASGSPNYTWSTGSQQPQISVTPASNAQYTVSGTAASGCIANKVHNINVQAKPVFKITASDTVVCPGQEVFMNGSGAVSFTWEPVGKTGYNFTQAYDQTTTFTLTGIDHKGCTNVAYFTLTVEECIGLKENASVLSAIEVFPNPAGNEVYVKAGVYSGKIVVTLSDLNGKVLLAKTAEVEQHELLKVELEKYSRGQYFIKISAGPGSTTRKIIKE